MATIDWEVLGHITPAGDMRIGGFAMGGEQIFDEPLLLEAMIDSFCESHEASSDCRFSAEGEVRVAALAATLEGALKNVRRRLDAHAALTETADARPSRRQDQGIQVAFLNSARAKAPDQ